MSMMIDLDVERVCAERTPEGQKEILAVERRWWQIDNKLPINPNHVRYVVMVQASGEELQRCLALTGRPASEKTSMYFFDADAKHIVGNW